ncbi:MAG: hypothetical protein Q9161_006642 [Pseudevernia consocians]
MARSGILSSKEDVEAPSVAMSRNNLTALSQYRNLLFVAYIDKVYVYTPNFPEQTITTKPELVIDLPRSRPGLRGYLDPSRPHAVNHLIVGDIGDEEVVVVACDDGDVISYFVRSICLAMEEGAKTIFEPDPYENQKLKRYRQSDWANLILPVVDPHRTSGFRVLAAWFHENVGASAWGLATHKALKLLAVSSNTKEINVYAPSLSSDGNQSFHSTYLPPKRLERYMTWQQGEKRNSSALRDRSLGKKVTLRGHVANIPNIAFCDNNLDPEGWYLASTDIDGHTFVWDIWGATPILETLGNAGPQAGELVHNNSQWHPGFSALGSVPGVLPTGTIPPVPQTAVPAVAGTPVDQDLEIGEEDEDEADEEMDDIASLNDASDADSLDATALEPTFPNQLSYTLDAVEVEQLLPGENSALEDGDFDLPDLEEVPEADQINQQTSQGNEKLKHDLFGLLTLVSAAAGENLKSPIHGFKKDINRFSDTTHAKTCPSFVDLPFNLLQTDERDIHLFRDIRFDADLKRRPPDSSHSQVLCQQALNQRMPPGFNYLSQMERLNMIAQIPELGVVVIGNQVGRVGILTMTRWEAQKQSGYKIECILPFSSEEAKGMRPRRPLMGMAVGPIQGQESALPHESPRMGTQPPRRFRLLMTYCDHTILSYEISRPDGEENIIVI